MNRRNKKISMMIAVAIVLSMVTTGLFAQGQTQGQRPQINLASPKEALTKYLELTPEKRKAENKVLMELFEKFRVADVRDGMDWIGYHNFGSVDPAVRPLWAAGTVIGIARTARYLPWTGPYPLERGDAYTRWQGMYYGIVCTYPWMDDLEDGDFVAIDLSGVDAGLLGSENTLRCILKGMRGVVINGAGIRDTEEVIMQKIPVWSHFISQAMDQGRIQFDAKDVPVAIGGVTIYPGDVIMADNDGVLVVPRKDALEVARWAEKIHGEDKVTRRKLYEQLGWELDDTVR